MQAAPSSAPFVGRACELEAISDCLERPLGGAAGSILIEGEAGIGKTRLLREALPLAERRGLQVLSASGQELQRRRPFGVLADALGLKVGAADPQRAAIADLLWGEAAAGVGDSFIAAGPGAAYRIIEDILALVERMASACPLVLALEDLHWADPSTLLALHAVARRLRDLPLTTIWTFRPSPRSAELELLVEDLADLGGTHLVLGPLADHDVHTLAAAVAGAPPGPGLRTQLERGHGNPFYCIELVQALAGEGVLELSGGRAEAAAPTLPPSLRVMLLRRLGHLPADSLEVLRLAAVLGSSFEVAQLALVSRRSVVELMGILDDALRAGMLEVAGDRIAFRHDLIHEALYTDLAQAIRIGLHLEVGRALADAGAPSIQVAQHLALGASPGDNQAVTWLRAAARDTQSRAPGVAAELLERAVDIAGPHHPSRDALLSELIAARVWSGRLSEAEAQARAVLARHHDPAVESALRLGLIEALLAQGKMVECHQESQAAIARPSLVGEARARLIAEAAFGPLFMGDLKEGVGAAETALRESERVNDDLAACMALSALSTAAMFEGRVSDAIAHATEAVERAQRSPTQAASTFHSNLFLGWALAEAERMWEADEALRRGRQLAEDLGAILSLPIYQWVLVWARFLAGKWDDAIAEAEAGLVLAEEVTSRVGVVSVHAMLALIALHRNDLRRAEKVLATGQAELAVSGPQPRVEFIAWAKALLEEARGDSDRALVTLSQAWNACTDRGVAGAYPLLAPDLVRMLVTAGQREQARAVVEQVEEVAPRMGTRWARGAALRCRALVEADPDAFVEAVTVMRAAPRPLERALTCEEAATALAEAGRTEEATALLDEALETYEELGAARDIARVEAGLSSLGHHPRRRGWQQRQAKVGWEALTRTELEVVALVGQGLTNREAAEHLYISPRTVETHLSHVFAKLGLSSRVKLRAEMARRGPPSP